MLDLDPELGEGLPADEFEAARRTLATRCTTIPAGPWEPSEIGANGSEISALLVVDGLLTRALTAAGRTSTELLGPGDVLRPWDQDGDIGQVSMGIEWRVLAPARIAVVDRRILTGALRWPTVAETLICRTLRRSRWLGFQLAIKEITRIEGRLILLLWALTERWGRVTPRGVQLELALTHEQLGRLVGARRPSVTTALGALGAAGLVDRVRGGFLLHGDASDALRHVIEIGEPGRVAAA